MERVCCGCHDDIASAWTLCLTSATFLLPSWFPCFVGTNTHGGNVPWKEPEGGIWSAASKQRRHCVQRATRNWMWPTNPVSLESKLAQPLGFPKRPQFWPTPSLKSHERCWKQECPVQLCLGVWYTKAVIKYSFEPFRFVVMGDEAVRNACNMTCEINGFHVSNHERGGTCFMSFGHLYIFSCPIIEVPPRWQVSGWQNLYFETHHAGYYLAMFRWQVNSKFSWLKGQKGFADATHWEFSQWMELQKWCSWIWIIVTWHIVSVVLPLCWLSSQAVFLY